MAGVDKQYLEGLKFKGAKRLAPQAPGERARHIPIERALKQEDVLSSRETETHVHIVAADGRKHAVEKKRK